MKDFLCSQTEPVVQVEEGKLRGFRYDGVYRFLGVPYARARRFHQPEKPARWEGVRNALAYGKICPILVPPNPDDEIVVPHRFWPESEHCQNLNIWTDTLDPEAKKPVMVWLHGGGFSSGSAIEHVAYEGDRLAKFDGVVSVSVNHRLNAFGFLNLSDFGPEYKNSENAGMADIVEALRWIRRNIGVFGGDPDNVTVFGQSGGGMKVTSLGQIPEADGLFHKAVVMSGVSFRGMHDNMVDWKAYVEELLSFCHIGREEVYRLEALNYRYFIKAINHTSRVFELQGFNVNWGPQQNDWYAGDPLVSGFRDHFQTIPTMVGSMFAEMARPDEIVSRNAVTDEEAMEYLKKAYGEKAEKVAELYAEAYPGKKLIYAKDVDTRVRTASAAYVSEKAKTAKAPVYNYVMASVFGYNGGKAPWHCADIPFAFHNAELIPYTSSIDYAERLEREINGAYIHFAFTGDPNGDNVPQWKPVTAETVNTMVFDERSVCRADYDTKLVELIESIVPSKRMVRVTPAEDEDSDRIWAY